MLGRILNLKPLIQLGRDKDVYGDFVPLPDKIRTMRKASNRMAELINESVGEGRKYVVSAGKHLYETAISLKDSLINANYVAPTSGAVVANGGPFIVVMGLPENYRK